MAFRMAWCFALVVLLVFLVACSHRAVGSDPSRAPNTGRSPTTAEPTKEPVGNPQSVGDPPEPVQSEKVEAPLTPLGFRPDLVLLLGQYQKDAPPAQLYGYEIRTGKLGQLTAGGGGDAWPVIPSPDGTLLAYFRQKPHQSAGLADGFCVRDISGGAPVCRWGEFDDTAAWRPGTHELTVSDSAGKASVLRVSATEMTPATNAQSVFWNFSPDGLWGVYWNDGLWVAPVDAHSKGRKLVDERGRVTWLGLDSMAIVVDPDYSSPNRSGKVYLASTDGTASNITQPIVDSVSTVAPDPKGRYLAANYGMLASVWKHSGAALYDLRQKVWTLLPFKGVAERAVTWVAGGKYLLVEVQEGQFVLYDPETGHTRASPVELKGTAFQGLSGDEDLIAFLTTDTRLLLLYRVSTGEVRRVETGNEQVLGVKWVPMSK